MKIKIIGVFILLILLYVMLPIGSSYSMEDVSNISINSTQGFSKIKISLDSFMNQAKLNNNPITSHILYPSTFLSRDLKWEVGELTFNHGEYYSDGKYHRAIDSGIYKTGYITSCPSGYSSCTDNILLSPVTGKITKVIDTTYKARENFSLYNKEEYIDSVVIIEATDAQIGRKFEIYHLVNIPSYIKVGYEIKQGDYIGTQCSQGNSTGSHLHFSVKQGDSRIKVSTWINDLILHSSISDIKDNTTSTIEKSGWTSTVIDNLNDRERYMLDSQNINIPNEFIIK